MIFFDKYSRISRNETIAVSVFVSVVALCIALNVGGYWLAAILLALCTGVIARYISKEPERMQSTVRRRTTALQELAYRDSLTALPNRRFFIWYMDSYLKQRAAAGKPMASTYQVVLFDLNGFKAVNDTYGHDAGDELLRFVSNSLTAQLPQDVLLARLGGDEFVALVGSSRQDPKARKIVDVIKRAVCSPLVYGQHRIQVSASVGVSKPATSPFSVEKMLREADELMYEDKIKGREAAKRSDGLLRGRSSKQAVSVN